MPRQRITIKPKPQGITGQYNFSNGVPTYDSTGGGSLGVPTAPTSLPNLYGGGNNAWHNGSLTLATSALQGPGTPATTPVNTQVSSPQVTTPAANSVQAASAITAGYGCSKCKKYCGYSGAYHKSIWYRNQQ